MPAMGAAGFRTGVEIRQGIFDAFAPAVRHMMSVAEGQSAPFKFSFSSRFPAAAGRMQKKQRGFSLELIGSAWYKDCSKG